MATRDPWPEAPHPWPEAPPEWYDMPSPVAEGAAVAAAVENAAARGVALALGIRRLHPDGQALLLALLRAPADRDVLAALADFLEEQGRQAEAAKVRGRHE